MNEEITVQGRRPDREFKERSIKFGFLGGIDGNGKRISLGGSEILNIEGYRSNVEINYSGGDMLPTARITVFNLPDSVMNTLSTIGLYSNTPNILNNYIIIYANTNGGDPITKVFEGSIMIADCDLNNAPSPVVKIQASTLGNLNMNPIRYTSFKGTVKTIDVVRTILNNFKLSLSGNMSSLMIDGSLPITHVVNCDVFSSMNSPVFQGDFLAQLRAASQQGGFSYLAHNRTLYIYPQGDTLNIPSESIFLVSPKTNMIGYPQYTQEGISINTIFEPNLLYGQPIEVMSNFKSASGRWNTMASLTHRISCKDPSGSWQTTINMAKRFLRAGTGIVNGV